MHTGLYVSHFRAGMAATSTVFGSEERGLIPGRVTTSTSLGYIQPTNDHLEYWEGRGWNVRLTGHKNSSHE